MTTHPRWTESVLDSVAGADGEAVPAGSRPRRRISEPACYAGAWHTSAPAPLNADSCEGRPPAILWMLGASEAAPFCIRGGEIFVQTALFGRCLMRGGLCCDATEHQRNKSSSQVGVGLLLCFSLCAWTVVLGADGSSSAVRCACNFWRRCVLICAMG